MTREEFAVELGNKILEIFGHPVKVYLEYKAPKDILEVTFFAKTAGKNSRYDLELENPDRENAIDHLLAQLPYQIISWIERNTEFGEPWFSMKRNDTTNMAGKDGKIRSYVMIDDGWYHELKITTAIGAPVDQ